MPRDIWESVPALYPTRSHTHPQSEATGYGGGGYDEVWEGMGEYMGTGPNFFRTRASSWSCFFCRVMELVYSCSAAWSAPPASGGTAGGSPENQVGVRLRLASGLPSQSLLGRRWGMDSSRAPWEGLSRKGDSQLCQPRELPEGILSLQGRQGGRGLPVSPEAPTVPLSQKQGSSLKLFLASAHLLVVPTPLWPVLNPDSRLMGLPSGPSRLPKAIPGPLRSSCPDSLQVQGKMRLSKIPAALALPASSSQSKGHQALAFGPLAIRPFLYSSPNTFSPRLPRALCPNG